MKISLLFRLFMLIIVLTVALPSVQAVPDYVVDLTTSGSYDWVDVIWDTSVNDEALFKTWDLRAAGSGKIQPFVRLSGGGEATIEGYNTDGRKLLYDENSSGQFTRQLKLEYVPEVAGSDIGGLEDFYYEFLLDINQKGSEGGTELSLDELLIAVHSTPDMLDDVATVFASPLYDLDAGDQDDIRIVLDSSLITGSGQLDMAAYIPKSLFPADPTGQYVYLYSMFGEPGSPFPNNDGFEEWAIQTEWELPIIPAPGAILLGGIGIGIVGWLRRRRAL